VKESLAPPELNEGDLEWLKLPTDRLLKCPLDGLEPPLEDTVFDVAGDICGFDPARDELLLVNAGFG